MPEESNENIINERHNLNNFDIEGKTANKTNIKGRDLDLPVNC